MTLWTLALLSSVSWAQQDQLLVPMGAPWRYATVAQPDASWTSIDFDDATWLTGNTQIGFGEGDQERTVPPDPANPYTTLYLRRDFPADPTGVDTLVLDLLVDDGALVWLNGTEIYRQNLPNGTIDALSTALLDIDAHAEHRFTTVRLPASALINGDNQLAVEVHQSSTASDDLSFDLGLAGTEGQLRITRGPYLQQATPTAITLRWRTDDAVPGTVQVGSGPNALNRTLTGPVAFDHAVLIDGLTPKTTYYYGLFDGPGLLAGATANHRFTTPPPTGEAQPTRIWVLGDSGTADAAAALVYQAYGNFTDRDTDLWLMLGDNAYGDGTDAQYQKAVFEMYPGLLTQSALWPTLGNHDGHTAEADGMIGPYFDIFTLPSAAEAGGVPSGTEAYYSFDHGNIHFIALDSESSALAAGSAQWVWLEEDLLASNADWLIAFWHHPPYSKGTHNSDFDLKHLLMRTQALPLLESYGVDLVLSGHSHGYERSMLIDGHYGTSVEFDPSMIVNPSLGQVEASGAYLKPELGPSPHRGAVYVVAGSSGQFGAGAYDHPVHLVSFAALGSVVLDVDGDQLDAQFLNHVGAVMDHFTILKGGCTDGAIDSDGDGICDEVQRHDKPTEPPGCGCHLGGGPTGAIPGALLLLALALRRRRATALLLVSGTAAAHPTADARITRIDQQLSTAPCDIGLLSKRAGLLAADGDLEQAGHDLDTARACARTDPAVAAARGPLLLALDRAPEAVAELEYASVLRPSSATVHADLAVAYTRVGRCDLATEAWAVHHTHAATLSPDAWLAWSRDLVCDARPEEALALITAAIDQLGPVPALELERIELLAASGQIDAAMARIEARTEGHPRPILWLRVAERILRTAGRLDEAAAVEQELVSWMAG